MGGKQKATSVPILHLGIIERQMNVSGNRPIFSPFVLVNMFGIIGGAILLVCNNLSIRRYKEEQRFLLHPTLLIDFISRAKNISSGCG